MKKLKILFPCDYFNTKEVDEAYVNEYNIAKSLGFECVLFNYDEFLETKKINIPMANESCFILYRGWMLKIDDYIFFDEILLSKGYLLINSPEMYELCHHFNMAYYYLEDVINTPKTLICSERIESALSQIKENFVNYFIMKDNVKSVKGSDFPDKISVDINVDELKQLIKQFIEYRDKLFTGQIILKQHVNLKKYNDTTNEWRVFYFFNNIISISKNSNQSDSVSCVPNEFVEKVLSLRLKSNFYTVDFAEVEDGSWIVIETGDGQVSGLSPNQNVLEFYTKIQNYF